MNVPASFRACASAYAILCGPLVALAFLWVIASLRSGSIEWDAVAICLGGAAAWAVWLMRFRLDLGETEFSYSSLFYKRHAVPYAAVLEVQATARGPVTGVALRVALRLIDGSNVPVNFKVFPREAGTLLLERIEK
jgi:hypothetical protein